MSKRKFLAIFVYVLQFLVLLLKNTGAYVLLVFLIECSDF